MSPTFHAAALAVALTVSAMAGPWMLRRASPALMRVPRLAIGLLVAGITSWVLALLALGPLLAWILDRKSTRLNSSHVAISYAVFCLKKKTQPARAAQGRRTGRRP